MTGKEFKIVQKEVSDMLNGRTLVGHAVYNDLKVSVLILDTDSLLYILLYFRTKSVASNCLLIELLFMI